MINCELDDIPDVDNEDTIILAMLIGDGKLVYVHVGVDIPDIDVHVGVDNNVLLWSKSPSHVNGISI